ncbi:MAG: SufE family protein [Leptospiraceae bacterium]|nr:SufE family protein [Leptospiraceae bacterium]MCP5503028.1 SufE family protein [Leptospiraceae bacterium]
MKNRIEEIQDEIIEEFSEFEDWQERFQYLVELGDALPPYPEEFRKEEYLVPGCQSRVWVHPRIENNSLFFDADSDTALTKGLIAILIRVFSGQAPKEIASSSLEFLEKVGLQKFLSISRRNGLNSMVNLLMNAAKTHNHS